MNGMVSTSLRYAGAARYVGSANRAGAAAAKGEQEKHKHYGSGVLPIAMEAGGRMGRESDGHLQRLADVAAGVAAGFQTRRGLAARWRRRLEQALMFAKADAVLCALGKSERGARTAARWCAARMQAAEEPRTQDRQQEGEQATGSSFFPACADELEDPFALMQEAEQQEQGVFELEAHLEACIDDAADGGADELCRGELP